MARPTEFTDRDTITADDPVGGGGGGTGGGGTTYNTGTAVASVTFTKTLSDSDLRIEAYAAVSNADDLQMPTYLILDGTIVQYGNINQIYDGTTSAAASTINLKMILSGVSAGQHTATFSMRNQAVRKNPSIVATGAILEVVEIKKAAR